MDKKGFAKEFERTILLAKARAYSKVSLERPLNESEFIEFRETMDKLQE